MSEISKLSKVLYAPWRHGQRKYGVKKATTHAMFHVNHLNRSFTPKSPIVSQIISSRPFIGNNEHYHEQVYQHRINEHHNDDDTLVIGGDHSVAIGSVLGSLSVNAETKKRMAVIWIDAHADINTLESSESKNVHGTPLSFITGLEDSWGWVNGLQKLDFKDLYYWGIRDLDNFEIDVIDKYGITVCKDKEEVMAIVDEYDRVHTSLDVDGLDPKYAPSTGTPVDHGLELDDVIEYLQYVHGEHKAIGTDLVEYNPEIGNEYEQNMTKHTVERLLNAIL